MSINKKMMRFKVLIFFNFLWSIILYSQSPKIEGGISLSKYEYRNFLGNQNPNVKTSSGNYFNITIDSLSLFNKKFTWGLSFTQYNATGGNKVQSYQWNTLYTGAYLRKNIASFLDKFKLNARTGFSTLIYGRQQIAGRKFNLNDSNEFNGIWNQTAINFEFTPREFSSWDVNFNYSIEKSFKIGSQGEEKLSFLTNFFGISVRPRRNKKIEQTSSIEKVNNIAIKDSIVVEDPNQTDRLEKEIEIVFQNSKNISSTISIPLSISVFFDLNSHYVKNSFFPQLQELVDYMLINEKVNISINGYADSFTGNNEFNKKLASKRVDSVIKLLVDMGISKDRIKELTFAETKSFGTNFEQLNRRVNIKTIINSNE